MTAWSSSELISPDGLWRWNGQAWEPAEAIRAQSVSAGPEDSPRAQVAGHVASAYGYGAQIEDQRQAYGRPVAQQGYGQPVAQQGYRQPVVEQGYGQPVVEQGYGQPVVEQGYGQPVAQQAYAQPVVATEGATYANPHRSPEFNDEMPSARGLPQPRERSSRVAVIAAGVAAALLVGGGITAGVSSSAKSELCDMIGDQESFIRASGDNPDELVKVETVAKRIHTLAGRLVFSGELKDAAVGFADAMETTVTLRRAGFEDTDEVNASTAARMDEVALSGVENLSQMQRSCGLPGTGNLLASTASAQTADKSAQSDVRGAISAVEQYYSENGKYPPFSISEYNSGGSMPQVALGTSTQKITLSDKTHLYYVPISGTYRICATNTGGSGKWYLYDSSRGGSVDAVSKPALPTSCA